MKRVEQLIKPGRKYVIAVNGYTAVNNARKLIGNKCYSVIEIDGKFAAQMEITIDMEGEYNGKPQQWIDFSFIPSEMVEMVITWLSENGFDNCFAIITEEDSQTSDYIEKHPEIDFVIPSRYSDVPILQNNQYVLFDNGYKGTSMEVIFDKRHEKYCYVSEEEDENGNRIRHYSNNVIEKKPKKRNFIPSRKSCTIRIYPEFETEKAYAVCDGNNGKICSNKQYYRYIAKSICYVDENGEIYAPVFAAKYIEN